MEKVRFALVGAGKGIGILHLMGILANRDAELSSVCDIDESTLENVRKTYGVSNTCTDYHELLDNKKYDAVCIATPDYLHREMVVDFLEAGIHVLCEKPLALSSEDCRLMMEAKKRSKAKMMVGQVCRKTPGFIKAKEIVDSGAIGELFFVESEYAHDYSHMKLHWRNDPKHPRHPVTGGGCHAVDLLRWIAGNPTEAYGYTNKKVLGDTWPCDDSAIAVLKFPKDVMGKVYVSTGCKRNYTMRTVLYGTKGTIITDNTSPAISLFLEEFEGKSKLFDIPMQGIEMKLPVRINNHNVAEEINDFVDIILNDKEVDIPVSEGAATVAVCETIIRSAASGKPEEVRYIKL